MRLNQWRWIMPYQDAGVAVVQCRRKSWVERRRSLSHCDVNLVVHWVYANVMPIGSRAVCPYECPSWLTLCRSGKYSDHRSDGWSRRVRRTHSVGWEVVARCAVETADVGIELSGIRAGHAGKGV